MKIFTADAVKLIDQYTIENEPIKSIDLMERASLKLKDWYVGRYRTYRKVEVLVGPGNNGGDALALARMLIERQYDVICFLVSNSGKYSEDWEINLQRLKEMGPGRIMNIVKKEDFPVFTANDVIIDGLFGSGLKRVIEGIYKELIIHLNNSEAEVISIDIPSGLFGEDNGGNDWSAIVNADHTLTFQFPFLSFFFAENEKYTGKWHVLDIGLNKQVLEDTYTGYSTSNRNQVAALLPSRNKFSHKGTYGHALVIAGSNGMMGASLLVSEAVLRSGAGLVTAHVPGSGYMIVQIGFPEAIVSIDKDSDVFSEAPGLEKYTALAAGPGLGNSPKSSKALESVLRNIKIPLVLDADALNLIAANPEMTALVPEGAILTPHPAEFDRLAGPSADGWSRHIKQIKFSVKHKLIVVLKGAYTGISFPDGSYVFNQTGNPGMATGGSGDVLTGIIVSLLAQGISPSDAAIAGVYLHGRAGDIAADRLGQVSMISRDIIKCLGNAFKEVKAKPFLHEGRTGGVIQ